MRLIPVWAFAITISLVAQEPGNKGREFLDSAAEMVSAASDQIQVASLLHIGLHYRVLSRAKAVEFLEQSFALTASLPEPSEASTRSDYQAQIILRAADVDTAVAIEMIRRATPSTHTTARNEAIAAVVSRLLAKEEIERAIEVVGIPPKNAGFPFLAASSIFEKLPRNDPRRIVLFGNAVSAYSENPSGPFPEMLSRFWKLVPQEMAQKGIAAILNRFLEENREGFSAKVVANDDGSAEMRTTEVRDMIEVFHVLRELEPKRAAELLAKFPVLGKGKAPSAGTEPATKDEEEDNGLFPVSMLSGMNRDTNMMEHFRTWNAAFKTASKVLKEIEKNPGSALDHATEIPLPSLRAEVIAKAARAQASKDPESARGAIDKALALLNELKSPSDSVMPRLAIAEASFALKDEPAAWKAFEGVFEDVAALYAKDTDSKSPNKALREFWPSIQTARIAGFEAAKLLGPKAEAFLTNIQIADLALAARIEMASALLGGKGPTVNSILVNF